MRKWPGGLWNGHGGGLLRGLVRLCLVGRRLLTALMLPLRPGRQLPPRQLRRRSGSGGTAHSQCGFVGILRRALPVRGVIIGVG
jgi:hypothetical protein